MTRSDTLFSVRYAVRVLERHSRKWNKISNIIRFFSLISGSAAIASLSATNNSLVLVSGIVFACLQALEFSINPSNLAAKSLIESQKYAIILANKKSYSKDDLEKEYLLVSAKDSVIVGSFLKELAYNDVALEQNADPEELYEISLLHRFFRMLS